MSVTDAGRPALLPTAGGLLAPDLTVRLLGRLEVVRDGLDYAPTAPKVLQLTALLVTAPGRVVPLDTIVEELWGDRPPASVRSAVQTYVYQLRRCVHRHGLAADPEGLLATRSPGYVLRIAPEQVDVTAFRGLVATGRALLAAGRSEQAAATLRTALAAWSGAPLANVACGPVLSRHAVDLDEQRRAALHLRIEADIARGAHRELVGELRALTTADPLDEELYGQLIRALVHSGRRTDAVSVYRDLRSGLVTELGVEPCGALRDLYVRLLQDPVAA